MMLDLMLVKDFSFSEGNRFDKNIITFVADMSSAVHIENNKKIS